MNVAVPPGVVFTIIGLVDDTEKSGTAVTVTPTASELLPNFVASEAVKLAVRLCVPSAVGVNVVVAIPPVRTPDPTAVAVPPKKSVNVTVPAGELDAFTVSVTFAEIV